MPLQEGPEELAFTSLLTVAGVQRWLVRMHCAPGVPSKPWLRAALTSLRSLLQARSHNGAGDGMVAHWERKSWPHRSGAPGGREPQNLPESFWHWPLAVLMPLFVPLVKLLH